MASEIGLSQITLGALAERAELSKSGLFAHFRSKEALTAALLEAALALGEVEIIGPAMAEPEGLPRLRALVARWLGWAPRCGLPGGCPFVAAMFELDDVESATRERLLAIQQEWREVLDGLVRQAIFLGQLRPDLDMDQFLWELNGIYLCHHVSQRFNREPDADRRAWTALESLIQRSEVQ